MNRPKLHIFSKLLEKEIKKAKNYTKKTKVAAQEIAKAAANSPSQSGDREHSKNQAHIAQSYLEKLLAIKDKLESTINNDPPNVIVDFSFIKLEFDDGRSEEFYFLQEPLKLDEIKIITRNSPLGNTLAGKSTNESFELSSPPLRGRVLEIG